MIYPGDSPSRVEFSSILVTINFKYPLGADLKIIFDYRSSYLALFVANRTDFYLKHLNLVKRLYSGKCHAPLIDTLNKSINEH